MCKEEDIWEDDSVGGYSLKEENTRHTKVKKESMPETHPKMLFILDLSCKAHQRCSILEHGQPNARRAY